MNARPWRQAPFTVERRAVEPVAAQARGSLTLSLPLPPAANNLFFNAPAGGRARSPRYRAWRTAAGWQARLQGARRVRGPVAIALTVEEGATRADLDNLAKAPIDLLCELQLIEGDHPAVIRELTLRWGAVEGLRVEVRPSP